MSTERRQWSRVLRSEVRQQYTLVSVQESSRHQGPWVSYPQRIDTDWSACHVGQPRRNHRAANTAYESGDPSDRISSEGEQSQRTGNSTKQCPPAELGNSVASDKPTADSDSSGMDSSGNDETREQSDFQLEIQASLAESFTICA